MSHVVTPRVAFTLIGGKNWTGGYNYLRNLLQVLAEEAHDSLTPILMAGEDVSGDDLAPFTSIQGCEVVRDRAFDAAARTGMLARGVLLGRDGATQRVLDRQRVDVVFESAAYLGWRVGRPAIAWIPDLQHRFLPHLFGRGARWRRELGFRAQVASGRVVMCSSEDTRTACERLYPAARGRVQAVRFAVRAPAALSDEEARAVAARHNLPERFFFMPNQFWAHKNHRLVLRALRELATQGEAVTVVASGRQHDPRNPQHVPSLLAEVKAARLESHFVTPGLLPYADLPGVMQASLALLNPSLFEGWSTTVEEAKAAGVPMLLSDIAVHREQASEDARYFDARSASSLAEALATFRAPDSESRQALREAAVPLAKARVARFASDFVRLVRQAADQRSSA